MKIELAPAIFEDWILRVRPGTGKRILLMLHGWTGDENSMSIFTRNLPSENWLLLPRAPYAANPGGFSWRMPAPRGSWPSVDLFRPSVEKLITLIDHWADVHGLDATTMDVAGFSQGGALALTLGVLYSGRVNKMGILAGFAPAGMEQVLQPGLLHGKNIFLAHGTLDEMVPIGMAHQAIQLLEGAGALVTYCESEVGHKLSSDCLKALERYLAN